MVRTTFFRLRLLVERGLATTFFLGARPRDVVVDPVIYNKVAT